MTETSIDELVVSGYDAVYAAMPGATRLREIWREHACGLDFPEEFGHISFLTLADIRKMAGDLALSPDGRFADLACGMGGPGLWIARETGSRVVGVDVSQVAIDHSTARAEALGLADQATFVHGSFAETGLGAESLDGAMSVDALQYAPSKHAAFAEIQRILRPGSRLAFTAFELDPERAATVPVIGIDPVDDFIPGLEEAGFDVQSCDEVEGWEERLTTAYQSVMDGAEALAEEMGTIAFGAFALEASLTLEYRPYRRRVSVLAVRR